MNAKHLAYVLLCAAAIMLISDAAWAWGPDAQRAIIGTSFQVVRRQIGDPFKTRDNETNFETDVLRGVLIGPAGLGTPPPTENVSQAIGSIGAEIQLLRYVRKEGVGSYFAFRMGTLARIVSDVLFPYSYDQSAASKELLARINADVDKNLESIVFDDRARPLYYVRNVPMYFNDLLLPYKEAHNLIAADYKQGKNYNGYLKNGTGLFFQKSVQAISDVWYTVLRNEADPTHSAPSDKAITWYYVDEISHLLNEKHNTREAERVYRIFAESNPGIADAFEKVGDVYYNYSRDDLKDRGVQIWMVALDNAEGPERNRINSKLAGHYLTAGKKSFDMAGKPEAPKDALEVALRNFTQALEIDRSNDEAASLINQTQVAIAERNERLQVALRTVAAAESVMREAEDRKVNAQYAESIALYNKAVLVFESVGDEFEEQHLAAQDGIESSKRNITDIINDVLNAAEDQIDQGDTMVEENRFDEAIAAYSSIPAIVSVVPDDAGPQTQQKEQLIKDSATKVEDAELAKMRFQTDQQNMQNQPGAAPGAAPPAAPAAPVAAPPAGEEARPR
ncbi:MAG: hypothetical protein AMXMBFR84_00920 [Candidatus Hydrogenedentota bacterium]